MTMTEKQIKLLTESIGTHVRLCNDSDEQMTIGRICIHVHGRLEFDDEEYYVRINEDPQGHGCNGVRFVTSNVLDVDRESSGITRITLRG